MVSVILFKSDNEEIKYLKNKDKRIEYLIDTIGEYELNLNNNYFSSLVNIIIGQQLSVKAANTIWNRFLAICPNVEPQDILSLDITKLKGVGLSRSKISYILDLSNKVSNNEIDFDLFINMDELEIISNLTKVKGIGQWSAEMFLIFSLGKLNVLSTKDLGIKRAIKHLYELEELPDVKYVNELKDKFTPYSTIVSLYLWETINRGIVK